MLTSLSQVPLSDDCALVFDLDDTLYLERDFLESGFREVARNIDPVRSVEISRRLEHLYDDGDHDPIGALLAEIGRVAEKSALLRIYREHLPSLQLTRSIARLLQRQMGGQRPIGLLSDGRSVTQRNKICALGLDQLVSEIVISEEFGSAKPNEKNFLHFQSVFPHRRYAYVGDNLAKDFVAPNRLGWTTIGLLDQGENIHPQRFESVPRSYHPQYWIEKIA
ncbi:MAG: HAD family hydrolase [Pirellulales bacterium]|nr:HAD family hydrolase [Pirellulales bacterium]